MAFGGSSDDYRTFVTAELPRLYRIALALTRSPDQAWDLTQDALIRVGLRWQHIDESGNPHGYAAATLVRLHLNLVRSSRREWLAVQRLGRRRQAAPLSGSFVTSLEPWLEDALQGLSRRQRAAVVLRYAADQSVEDVAATLDCTVATAKTHLQRGLSNLRAKAPVDARQGQGGARQ